MEVIDYPPPFPSILYGNRDVVLTLKRTTFNFLLFNLVPIFVIPIN